MTPSALLLDLDGTLVDTEPVYIEAFRLVLPEFGITPTEEELLATVGLPDEVTLPPMMERRRLHVDVARLVRRKDACFVDLVARGLAVRPGTHELLNQAGLLGITCMVVSSSDRPLVTHCLEVSGLAARLPMRICGTEAPRRKPSPDPYLLAASRLGLPPSRCLVVEDSLSGLRSACQAGCAVVAVSGSFPDAQLREAGAGRVLDSLEDLLQLDGGDVRFQQQNTERKACAS